MISSSQIVIVFHNLNCTFDVISFYYSLQQNCLSFIELMKTKCGKNEIQFKISKK